MLRFFLAELREDIKGKVRIQDPQELMAAMRIPRDVEDMMSKAWGGGWNDFKVNQVGTRATTIVIRGEVDRQSTN